jgi:hypothetical protein
MPRHFAGLGGAYQSRIDAAVLSASHNEAIASNEQTIGEGGVFGLVVTSKDGRDALHLLRLQLRGCQSVLRGIWGVRGISHVEAGGSGPDTIARDDDDGGRVDVAGANQAIEVLVHWFDAADSSGDYLVSM